MKTLESLRHKLNKNAELSGQEKNTNKIINNFFSNNSVGEISLHSGQSGDV